MSGYIKLHRQITRWGWYDDPATKIVFLHLLLKANWHKSEYHGVTLEPGDVVFGRKKFAKELGLSEQNVRTAIRHLHETCEISTVKVTNRFSVIHVENWAIYQGQDEDANHQANQQLTNNQPATNHVQEYKKYKNNNKSSFNTLSITNEYKENRPASERFEEMVNNGFIAFEQKG